jgi:hypothetical protein
VAEFSIAPYSVRVHERGDPHSFVRLGNINGRSLTEIVAEFLEEIAEKASRDDDARRVVRSAQYETSGRQVQGLVETGEFGYRSELIDVDTAEVTHVREANEAGMLPFYFLFDLPPRADRGFVLLQRFRVYGIRKAFLLPFSSWFAERFDDYILDIGRIVPPEAWQEYAEGRVVALKFVAASVPQAIEDAYLADGYEEAQAVAEFNIRVRRNADLPRRILARVREAVRGQRAFDQIVELPGIDVETVKVIVEHDGSRRTLEIGALDKFRVAYDITDSIEVDTETGFPTLDSLKSEAGKLLRQLKKDLGSDSGDAE